MFPISTTGIPEAILVICLLYVLVVLAIPATWVYTIYRDRKDRLMWAEEMREYRLKKLEIERGNYNALYNLNEYVGHAVTYHLPRIMPHRPSGADVQMSYPAFRPMVPPTREDWE